MKENERKMKREEEERENWKSKNTVTESLIDFDLIQCRGLYSLTKCVKNQNNQYNKITLRSKWELHKTGSFGSKSKGDKFRYAVNFAIIAKIQGIVKIQIFSMHSNFRYDSEFSL